MTRIISNLPKEYKNIVENLEDELYGRNRLSMIKIIQYELSTKYDIMNVKYNQKKKNN